MRGFSSRDACMSQQQRSQGKGETVWNEGKEEEIKRSRERLAGGKKTTGNRPILMLFLQILQR